MKTLVSNKITPYVIFNSSTESSHIINSCYEKQKVLIQVNETATDNFNVSSFKKFIETNIVNMDKLVFLTLLFQIVYTLIVFNKIQLQHNDLHLENILVLQNKFFNIFNKDIRNEYTRPPSPKVKTYYFKYDKSPESEFYLLDIGINCRIFDFDKSWKYKPVKQFKIGVLNYDSSKHYDEDKTIKNIVLQNSEFNNSQRKYLGDIENLLNSVKTLINKIKISNKDGDPFNYELYNYIHYIIIQFYVIFLSYKKNVENYKQSNLDNLLAAQKLIMSNINHNIYKTFSSLNFHYSLKIKTEQERQQSETISSEILQRFLLFIINELQNTEEYKLNQLDKNYTERQTHHIVLDAFNITNIK
jgi:hypothetical protein